MSSERDRVIQPGEQAPTFSLQTQDREDWSLGDALKKGPVVLCFFPFAFTEVCQSEMECLTNQMDRWMSKGLTAVGISGDSPMALKAWSDQLGLKHTMLSDLHRAVCKEYGLHWAELNVAQRGTVILNRDGTVAWSEGREPGTAMDFDAVMAHSASS